MKISVAEFQNLILHSCRTGTVMLRKGNILKYWSREAY
jgi:hypothetical protein